MDSALAMFRAMHSRITIGLLFAGLLLQVPRAVDVARVNLAACQLVQAAFGMGLSSAADLIAVDQPLLDQELLTLDVPSTGEGEISSNSLRLAGIADLLQGNPKDAIATLNLARAADGAHDMSEFWLGMAWQRAGVPEKANSTWQSIGAVAQLLEAAEIDGDVSGEDAILQTLVACSRNGCSASAEAKAWAWLGELYHKELRYEEAIEAFRSASALHPAAAAYRVSLTNVYLDAGDLQGARAVLLELTEDFPDRYLHYLSLGEVSEALGMVADAEAAFKRAVELSPQRRAYFALSRFYANQHRWLDLDALMTAYIERHPEDACPSLATWASLSESRDTEGEALGSARQQYGAGCQGGK